jgi:hypothetical protein
MANSREFRGFVWPPLQCAESTRRSKVAVPVGVSPGVLDSHPAADLACRVRSVSSAKLPSIRSPLFRSILRALAIVSGISLGFAQEFEITGDIEYEYFEQEQLKFSESRTFTVMISNCDIKITTFAKAIPDRPYPAVYEYGTRDRTNSYVLCATTNQNRPVTIKHWVRGKGWEDQEVPLGPDGKPKIKPHNDANLTIVPTVVPSGSQGLIVPVWLAYGSRCYLRAQTSKLVEPASFFGNNLQQMGFRTKADWAFSPSQPNFLERITYFSDGRTYRLENGEIKSESLPSPYNTEITNAIFSVSEWTNCVGLSLPLDFRLTEFRPRKFGRKKSDLEVASHAAGVARTFKVNPDLPSFSLQVPPKTLVSERRLARLPLDERLPQIQYLSEDGTVLSLDDVRKSKKFQIQLKALKDTRQESSRAWVPIFLTSIAIAPLVVMWFKRRANRQLNV